MASLEQKVKAELEYLVKFWNQSEGRDKFTKAIQYGSRLIAYLATNNKVVATQFTDLMKVAGDSRKIFRLGKSVNEYNKVQDILKSSGNNVVRVSNALSRAGFLFYWFYDNLVILRKINFLRSGDLKAFTKKANTFWTVGLLFGIFVELYNLYLIEQREDAAKKVEGGDPTAELEKCKSDKRTCYINLGKNFGDLITATNGMELPHRIIGRPFSEGLIGFGGLTSALLTIYQLYPQRTTPKKLN